MSDETDWEDELITAVRTGNVDSVQQLLDAGARMKVCSCYGETPLGVAAGRGALDMMRLLLRRGADPDEDDYEGYTAIDQALMHSAHDSIDLLLDWGTPHEQSRRTVSALLSAAHFCSLSLMVRLIDRGVDINRANDDGTTALIASVQIGVSSHLLNEEQRVKRRQIIRLLLERGANVHQRHDMFRWSRERIPAAYNAMYHAAHQGDRETVELLRQAGAEITLTEAASVGDYETVRLLLGQGQEPDWRDINGETALYFAAANGHVPVVNLLLARGADPYLLSGEEGYAETALAAAANAKQAATASELLRATLGIHLDMSRMEIAERLNNQAGRNKLLALLGEDAHQTEQDGYRGLTPLMNAVDNDNPEMVNVLLGAGLDVNFENYAGYTALMIACERALVSIVHMLLEAGADPKKVNAQGYTALVCAITPGADDNLIRSGYSGEVVRKIQADILEIVCLLIAAGADVNAHLDYCRTPLEYALEMGRKEVVELLRIAGASATKKEL